MWKIESDRGFYVGDICYVLEDDVYHGVWGASHYEDGVWRDPKTGYSFAVAGTAFGDGTYYDSEGHEYGVDAGVIGIVPLELVGKPGGLDDGRVIECAGCAGFDAKGGVFDIGFPNGEYIVIDTNEEESDDWDGCDDEMGYDPYLGCYTDDV